MGIIVRNFTQDDIDGCLGIINSHFEDEKREGENETEKDRKRREENSRKRYSRDELATLFSDMICNPRASILVAVSNEGLVLGIAAIIIEHEMMDKEVLLIRITQLVVRKGYVSGNTSGPTFALLKKIRDIALKNAISKIECKCRIPESANFCEQMGFGTIGSYRGLEFVSLKNCQGLKTLKVT